MIVLEIEDLLDEFDVFEGLDGNPAHMDSYLTTLNYTKFYVAFEKIKSLYTITQLKDVAEYWIKQNYISPMCGLAGRIMLRKLKEVI